MGRPGGWRGRDAGAERCLTPGARGCMLGGVGLKFLSPPAGPRRRPRRAARARDRRGAAADGGAPAAAARVRRAAAAGVAGAAEGVRLRGAGARPYWRRRRWQGQGPQHRFEIRGLDPSLIQRRPQKAFAGQGIATAMAL